MDRATEELVGGLDHAKFSVLEISGNKWQTFEFHKYKSVRYPEFDICSDVLTEKFDLIIAEQVFEHLTKPFRAGTNVFNMLKDGGYFLITTPFLVKIHPSPEDCTRWSRTGIKFFLEECGFALDQIESFSWGNRKCVNANFRDWIPFNPSRHSLENEEEFPVVIWALARKQV